MSSLILKFFLSNLSEVLKQGIEGLLSIAKTLVAFSPSINFLSDIVAFEASVIAIAIPLSIEIISRISERYNSEVITRKFNQEWVVQVLPILLTTNIILSVSLKFFLNGSPNSNAWKVTAWISFIIFLLVSVILVTFFIKLRQYITSTSFLLNHLFVDVQEVLSEVKTKTLQEKEWDSRQEKFISALEGIGDVLVFDVKNKKGKKDVIQGLKKINNIVIEFLDIQKNDPDKFERLSLSPEFFSFYQKNQRDANLSLLLAPDTYLVSFSTAITQLLRIHQVAIDAKNDEASRFATYHLIWLLSHVSQIQKNKLLVQRLLEKLFDAARNAIESKDSSMYEASLGWYSNIVFQDKSFDLSYLTIFNENLFRSVRYVISNTQDSIFNYFISSLVDGTYISDSPSQALQDYKYFILLLNHQKFKGIDQKYSLTKKIERLEKKSQLFYSEEQLNDLLKSFDSVKNLLYPYLELEQKKESERIEEEVKESLVSAFKYRSLLETVFTIGAYCLFKKQFTYIKSLWEYQQPEDADANWVGHDIVPNNLEGLINLYFGKSFFQRRPVVWDEHHGSELYYKKYFLLMLIRLLIRNRKKNLISVYNFSEESTSHRLSAIHDSIDRLVEFSNEIKEELVEILLKQFEFKLDEINEAFDDTLVRFMESLKFESKKALKALERAKEISKDKIEIFKKDLLSGFSEMSSVREVFVFYNSYKEEVEESSKDLTGFGIDEAVEKSTFFDEWYLCYDSYGRHRGRDIAIGENLKLIELLINYCTEISVDNFEEVFQKFHRDLSNIAVILVNQSTHDLFENSKAFQSKWNPGVDKLNIKIFDGWYAIEDKLIPVFTIYCKKIGKKALVVNTSKLGCLTQYLFSDKNDQRTQRSIFSIRVESFSKNRELMQKFLKNPPDWLEKIGDENEQEEYLCTKVLVQAIEKFDLTKAVDFQGYVINLGE